MDALSTYFVEETFCMSSRDEEEDDEDEGTYESQTEEAADQRPTRPPSLFCKTDTEVFHYAEQEIIIEKALDSEAGAILPEALALSRYLDTHREQLNLADKAVLEIGAGSGLVSVVAALLGAWVTATDLPERLDSLRASLIRNTRGRCRHTPKVAALSWDYNLKHTFPTSLHRFDYVLAADAAYHHDVFNRVLAAMKHFCRPGTRVVWANRVAMESELAFTENFEKAFHTRLLAEDGETRIVMATCREGEGEDELEIKGQTRERGEVSRPEGEEGHNQDSNNDVTESERRDDEEEGEEDECDEEKNTVIIEEDKPKDGDPNCRSTATDENVSGQVLEKQTAAEQVRAPAWTPKVIFSLSRDIYHYAGQDIVIYESMDSFGAVMWPAALALCSFLDHNREEVNLQGKTVLELGAGTGLVTIVAALLGAAVTATDLPDVLSNLRANVMRNTRGRCRHLPQVEVLSWGYDLEPSYPPSLYRYDYVLAADVVYHHNFLDELLATMKHFCRPGTRLIWANRVRMENDLTFTETFKKTFHTRLLLEDGDMKIFMAMCREGDTEERLDH